MKKTTPDEDRINIVERFQSEAEAVDAKVFVTGDVGTLVQRIKSFCKTRSIKVLPSRFPETGIWEEVKRGLAEEGISLLCNFNRDTVENYGAGLNAADFGVADTGTLIFFESSPDDVRLGTLPIHHLVILRSRDIYPSLSEVVGEIDTYLAKHLNSGEACGVSLISGPSRTADIERELTVGVHGPKELAIFVLNEGAGNSGDKDS